SSPTGGSEPWWWPEGGEGCGRHGPPDAHVPAPPPPGPGRGELPGGHGRAPLPGLGDGDRGQRAGPPPSPGGGGPPAGVGAFSPRLEPVPDRGPGGPGGPLEPADGPGPGLLCQLGQRGQRSEEHTSELQSRENLVCRLL